MARWFVEDRAQDPIRQLDPDSRVSSRVLTSIATVRSSSGKSAITLMNPLTTPPWDRAGCAPNSRIWSPSPYGTLVPSASTGGGSGWAWSWPPGWSPRPG